MFFLKKSTHSVKILMPSFSPVPWVSWAVVCTPNPCLHTPKAQDLACKGTCSFQNNSPHPLTCVGLKLLGWKIRILVGGRHVYIYIYLFIYLFLPIYIYNIYIYTYVHIHIHIHIFSEISLSNLSS